MSKLKLANLKLMCLCLVVILQINISSSFTSQASVNTKQNKGNKEHKNQVSQLNKEAEETRKLWNTQFLEKRPIGKSKIKRKENSARNYKKLKSILINNNEIASLNPIESTLVGLTLWQLRKPTEKESELSASRIFAQVDSEDLIPERIDINEPIIAGQKFRFSLEVAQEGYLYIIDQERYSDGSLGEAYLIFPTTQTRKGNNRVKAGISIEVPDQIDRIPYFTLLVNNPKYSGEQLTIVVSPIPIKDIPISSSAKKLSKEQVENLQNLQSSIQILNLEGTANNNYTSVEKSAGKGNSLLTQEDPLPQTLYQVATKPNKPFVFSIPIAVKEQ